MTRKLFFIIWIVMFSLIVSGGHVFGEDFDKRFTDNGDGTVTDHKLNVMWLGSDNQGDINWKEAMQWIDYTLPITTPYEDWRMPTLEELKSLYITDDNYNGYVTSCGQKVRIAMPIKLSCGWVWSSEKRAITARVFNFHRGYHYTDRMAHSRAYRVLPVRDLKK